MAREPGPGSLVKRTERLSAATRVFILGRDAHNLLWWAMAPATFTARHKFNVCISGPLSGLYDC